MNSSYQKLIITGGAGFIGSACVRLAVEKGYHVTVIDKLTYAGDLARIDSVKDRITFHHCDICDHDTVSNIFEHLRPDALLNFAAETHVDRSILNRSPFIQTNIQGTSTLIDLALKYKIPRFLQISTDEVYGSIQDGAFQENAALNPNNPYSASKAAADMMIQAAGRTFGLPAVTVRPCNNYGPWQYPEKFIPLCILRALSDQATPIFGAGDNRREWIYVDDCVRAILTVLEKGETGAVYNIGSGEEHPNIEMVQKILHRLGKPETLYRFVPDRPGHDFRYLCECRHLPHMGWHTEIPLDTGLIKTIDWVQNHFTWMQQKAHNLEDYWHQIYNTKDAS